MEENRPVFTLKDKNKAVSKLIFTLTLVCAFCGGFCAFESAGSSFLAAFLDHLIIALGLMLCLGFVFILAYFIADQTEKCKPILKVAIWVAVYVVAFLFGRGFIPKG